MDPTDGRAERLEENLAACQFPTGPTKCNEAAQKGTVTRAARSAESEARDQRSTELGALAVDAASLHRRVGVQEADLAFRNRLQRGWTRADGKGRGRSTEESDRAAELVYTSFTNRFDYYFVGLKPVNGFPLRKFGITARQSERWVTRFQKAGYV